MIWSRRWGWKGSPSPRSPGSAEFDQRVPEFRERPLNAGPYRYLWIDALTQKVREGGRVVNVSAVIATAVTAEGQREIIGFHVITTETTDGWTEFLRSLVTRGLTGVELVISDAHGGIKAAIAGVLSGASWQKRRTHFMANIASRSPKASWPMIATLVRSVFEQPDRDATGTSSARSSTGSPRPGSSTRPSCSSTPPTTSWRSPRSRSSTGPRSARTTPRNA